MEQNMEQMLQNADFSALEVACIIHKIRQASQGYDFYKTRASNFFGIGYDDVTDTERKLVKANTWTDRYSGSAEYYTQDAVNTNLLFYAHKDMRREIAYEVGIRDAQNGVTKHSEAEDDMIAEYESRYIDGLMVGMAQHIT